MDGKIVKSNGQKKWSWESEKILADASNVEYQWFYENQSSIFF